MSWARRSSEGRAQQAHEDDLVRLEGLWAAEVAPLVVLASTCCRVHVRLIKELTHWNEMSFEELNAAMVLLGVRRWASLAAEDFSAFDQSWSVLPGSL